MSRNSGTDIPAAHQGEAATDAWITDGNLPRAIWRLALPMTGAAVLADVFTLVDLFFVGKLGPAAIAAVGIGGIIASVIYMLGVGVTTGCTALVAKAIGAGEGERAELVAGQAMLLCVALSVGVAAVGIPVAAAVLRLLGAEGDVLAMGASYLRITCGGSIAIFLTITFGAALRGAGDATTPLRMVGFATLVNVILDPILIFGLLGVPAMGVAGSAWATVAARGVSALLLGRVFFRDGHRHFRLTGRHLLPRWRLMWEMVRIGIFGSGRMLLIHVSGMAMVRLVAGFGTAALAAFGIGRRLQMLVFMPGMGFANAAATLTGQNLGAGRPDRAVRAGWLTAGIYGLIALAMTAIFAGFARPLVGIFNSDPAVVDMGTSFIRWFAVSYVALAFSLVLGRAMMGAGDTFWPMVLTGLGAIGVRIPLAVGLTKTWGSATGVWAAMSLSNFFMAVFFILAFRWGRWKVIGMRQMER